MFFFGGCKKGIGGRGGMKLTCGTTVAEEKAKAGREDKVTCLLFFLDLFLTFSRMLFLGFFDFIICRTTKSEQGLSLSLFVP